MKKNLQNMSGEQLLLERICGTTPHKDIIAELHRRRPKVKIVKFLTSKAA